MVAAPISTTLAQLQSGWGASAPVEFKNINEIDHLGDELRKVRADGLLIGANPIAMLNLRKIAELPADIAECAGAGRIG